MKSNFCIFCEKCVDKENRPYISIDFWGMGFSSWEQRRRYDVCRSCQIKKKKEWGVGKYKEKKKGIICDRCGILIKNADISKVDFIKYIFGGYYNSTFWLSFAHNDSHWNSYDLCRNCKGYIKDQLKHKDSLAIGFS